MQCQYIRKIDNQICFSSLYLCGKLWSEEFWTLIQHKQFNFALDKTGIRSQSQIDKFREIIKLLFLTFKGILVGNEELGKEKENSFTKYSFPKHIERVVFI